MSSREYYSITKENLQALFSNLAKEADLYLPKGKEAALHYARFDPGHEGDYVIDQIRAAEPIKGFLTRSRERVDRFPANEKRPKRQIITGVKSCDLASLKIQDFVFSDTDPKDPFYISKRVDTFIISCDCNLLWPGCFCVALNIEPYPQEGFDLNLSKNADDIIVEVGSQKGGELIKRNKGLFTKASLTKIKAKDTKRQEFKRALEAQIKKDKTPDSDKIKGSIKKVFGNAKMWEELASTCIECGGCNHVCPTCHCFLLTDEEKGSLKARYKSWDACLYNRFARVAGGANPRRHLYERLRNRFDKKFEFFPNVLNMYACTGCGRCIEACPGKIDIREVLKKAIDG